MYNFLQMLDALTCPTNRNGTREEHACNDEELNKNPERLLMHYVKFGGASDWEISYQKKFEEGDEFTQRLFFYFEDYKIKEIIAIILDETNRDLARTKHSCNDDELFFHPEWLLESFMERKVLAEFSLHKMAKTIGE